MASTTDQLIMELRARDRGLQMQLRAINTQLKKVGVNSGAAAAGMDRAGRKAKGMRGEMAKAKTMILGIVAALGALAVKASVGVFVQFSREMNNVRAITNATDEDFQSLIETAEELGRTTQFTARDVATAMSFLARTGLDVNQTLGALPGTLNLAAATATDLGTAADISTNVMKAMRLEVEDLTRVVDTLAKTTNSSNTDIVQLAEGLKYVAPVAANAGMEIEEIAAIIGILGDAGIQGSLAGVALRRSILNLTTGMGGAGGTIKTLGLQIRDAEGNFVGLTNVIEQLNNKVLSDKDVVSLFGARAVAAAQVLMNKGAPAIRAFQEALEDAGGTAERMAKQQMAGLPGVAKRLTSSFEGLQIFLGRAMEPTLIVLGEALIWVNQQLRYFVAGWQGVGVALGVVWEGLTTAVETIRDVVSFVLSGLIGEIAWVVEKAGWLAKTLGLEIGESVERAGTAMRAFADNAMVGALEDIGAQAKEFGLVWENAGNQLEELAVNASAVGEAAERAAAGIGMLGDPNLNNNLDNTNDALEKQKELLEELAEMFAGAMLTAAERSKGAIQQLRRDLIASGAEITDAVEAQLNALLEGTEQALREERAKAVAKGFGDALKAELEDIAFSGLGARTDEDQVVLLERQRQALQRQVDLVQERLELGVDTVEEERALIKLVLEFNRAMGTATTQQKSLLDTINDGSKDTVKDLQSTLHLIQQAVSGTIQLAEAFGILNEETAETVQHLADIAEGAATAAAGISSGNPGAILAGGLQLLGGVAGLIKGDSSAEDALRSNTESIYLLVDQMAELGERIKDQKDEMEKALRLARRGTSEKSSGFLGLGTTKGVKLSPDEYREILRAAQAVGLVLPDKYLKQASQGLDVFLDKGLANQLAHVLEGALGEADLLDEEGVTQSISKSVSITELQANQLLAYQASQLQVLEDILAVLYGGTALVGAPAVGSNGGVVTIQVGPNEIYLGSGGSVEQAAELVDEVLLLAGQRLADQDQLLGVKR